MYGEKQYQTLVERLHQIPDSQKLELFPIPLGVVFINEFLADNQKTINLTKQQRKYMKTIVEAKLFDAEQFRNQATLQIIEKVEPRIYQANQFKLNQGNEEDVLKEIVKPSSWKEKDKKLLAEEEKQLKRTQKKNGKSDKGKTPKYDVITAFLKAQRHFDSNFNDYDPSISRLKKHAVDIDIINFDTNSKIFKAIQKQKTLGSLAEKYALEMAGMYNKNENPSFADMRSISINDSRGLWIITREKININDNCQYNKSTLNKLKEEIFHNQLFGNSGYQNFYRQDHNKNITQMYIFPSEINNPVQNGQYHILANEFPSLGHNHLVFSLHIQGVYAAVEAKLFGQKSHRAYKDRQLKKQKEVLANLPKNTRLQLYDGKMNLLELLGE